MESHVSREIIGLCERVDKWSTAYGASRTTEARFRFHHPLPVIYPHHGGLYPLPLGPRHTRFSLTERVVVVVVVVVLLVVVPARRLHGRPPRDCFSPPRDTTGLFGQSVMVVVVLLFFAFLFFFLSPPFPIKAKAEKPSTSRLSYCATPANVFSNPDHGCSLAGSESDNLVNRVPLLSRQRGEREREICFVCFLVFFLFTLFD